MKVKVGDCVRVSGSRDSYVFSTDGAIGWVESIYEDQDIAQVRFDKSTIAHPESVSSTSPAWSILLSHLVLNSSSRYEDVIV